MEHLPAIEEKQELVNDLRRQVKDFQSLLDNGVCPTCSTLLVSKNNIHEFTYDLNHSTELLEVATKELKEIQHAWYTVELDLKKAKIDRREDIRKCETSLTIATELNLALAEIAGRGSEEIRETLKPIQHMQSLLSYIRTSIKEGVIVRSLLETFFEIVQVKMADYAALINMNGTEVSINVNKLGMGIALSKNGDFVPVSTLSNGEKTRLSILLLVSMLSAMKEVSNAETNYLVFDEASASFDASGVDELEALFTYMKAMGQSSFVITHGSEMEKVQFDHVLKVRKEGGLSYV